MLKIARGGGEEADFLGRLRHPNIVPVYSVGKEESTNLTAFCMPYLGRATLCDLLDHVVLAARWPCRARVILDVIQAVNPDQASPDSLSSDRILRSGSYVNGIVHLMRQLANALAHSHERGIFHRDLKPSNVLLSPEGRPLLLDFNLSVTSQPIVNKVGGTLPYMAPEELRKLLDGKAVDGDHHYDPRSDLFSLGVIAYELLAGTLPFDSVQAELQLKDAVDRLYRRQVNGPVPLHERNPQVDKRLSRLVCRCLMFDPEMRPKSAQELADLLRRELTTFRRGCRWVGNHRWSCGIATAIALLAVFGGSVAIACRPPYSVRQLELGLVLSREGRYELAVDCFSNSIRVTPQSHEAMFARGRALEHLGDFRAAFDDFVLADRMHHSGAITHARATVRLSWADMLPRSQATRRRSKPDSSQRA